MANQEISSNDIKQINYRPHLEYQKPIIDSLGTLSYTTPSPAANPILVTPIIKDAWTSVQGVVSKIDSIEQTLSAKLGNTSVPIPSDRYDISLASRYFGGDGATITFALYKKVIYDQSSEGTLLRNAFESYHADVNGDLNAELYADIVEMKLDWQQMQDFIKRGLFGQIGSPDDTIDNIHKAEQKLINNYNISKSNHGLAVEALQAAYSTNEDSADFHEASIAYQAAELVLNPTERKVVTRAEALDLINSKVTSANITLSYLSGSIDFKAYKGNAYEILYNLLKQYASRQDLEKGLRKIQALIKLSVDGKIENTNNIKTNLQGVSSLLTKKKMNDSLVTGIHLRNEVYGDTHDFVSSIDGFPDSDAFHSFIGHIADSVEYADQTYVDQVSDFYKVHTIDADLRQQKFSSLIDKESARKVYQWIDLLFSYMAQYNWPEAKNLSQWLQDFLKAKNIS